MSYQSFMALNPNVGEPYVPFSLFWTTQRTKFMRRWVAKRIVGPLGFWETSYVWIVWGIDPWAMADKANSKG